jgi:hypothetical protein
MIEHAPDAIDDRYTTLKLWQYAVWRSSATALLILSNVVIPAAKSSDFRQFAL